MQAARLNIAPEEWLTRLFHRLRPLFRAAGAPLGERVRIVCAPTPRVSKGGAHKRFECWAWWNSAGQTCEIVISAALGDPLVVATTLVEALVHARTGFECDAAFKNLAGSVGLARPWTAPLAGEGLKMRLSAFLAKLGPYPHAALDGHPQRRRRRAGKSQQVKVVCPRCGCPARTSASWLRRASLICGACRVRMRVDPRDVERVMQAPRKPGRPRKPPPIILKFPAGSQMPHTLPRAAGAEITANRAAACSLRIE